MQTRLNPNEWLPAVQAARKFGYSYRQVSRLIARGALSVQRAYSPYAGKVCTWVSVPDLRAYAQRNDVQIHQQARGEKQRAIEAWLKEHNPEQPFKAVAAQIQEAYGVTVSKTTYYRTRKQAA